MCGGLTLIVRSTGADLVPIRVGVPWLEASSRHVAPVEIGESPEVARSIGEIHSYGNDR